MLCTPPSVRECWRLAWFDVPLGAVHVAVLCSAAGVEGVVVVGPAPALSGLVAPRMAIIIITLCEHVYSLIHSVQTESRPLSPHNCLFWSRATK